MNNELNEFIEKLKNNLPEKNKKTTITTDSPKRRKHNHLPQGKSGFVPRPCSDQINIRKAKR